MGANLLSCPLHGMPLLRCVACPSFVAWHAPPSLYVRCVARPALSACPCPLTAKYWGFDAHTKQALELASLPVDSLGGLALAAQYTAALKRHSASFPGHRAL